MPKLNRKIIMGLICIIPLLFCGCWDYRDINDRNIMLSVGVDEADGQVEYVGEYANLPTGAYKEKLQLTDVFKYRSVGKDFEEARNDLSVMTNNPSFNGAVRVVVFSESYARKNSIEPYINRLNFNIETRKSRLAVVSKESSKEIIFGRVENDVCVGYGIENTIRQLSSSGITLYPTIQNILSDTQYGQIGYLVPYVTREQSVIKYLGLAVMKDSKIAGIVERKDSSGFMSLLAKNPVRTLATPHPKNKKNMVSVNTKVEKRKIKTSYENNKVNININIKISAQVIYEYMVETLTQDDRKKIEDDISKKIKEDVTSSIKLSQEEYKCDVFYFAKHFNASHHNVFKKINWEEEYPKAKISVKVETALTSTTLLDPNTKSEKYEDK